LRKISARLLLTENVPKWTSAERAGLVIKLLPLLLFRRINRFREFKDDRSPFT
jgi:hypothetical protein